MANAIIIEPRPFAVLRAHEAVGFSADHLRNDYRGVFWRSPPQQGSALVVDLGADVSVDTVMLFGLWGNLPVGSGVNIALATAAQGPGLDGTPVDRGGAGVGSFYFESDQPVFAGADPIADGNGVLLWRKPAAWPARFRYVSFYFFGLTDQGFVQASRLVVGQAISLERNFSFGAGFGVKDLGGLEFSRRGVLLRNRGAKLRTASLTFSSVRKDEVEQLTKPLLERIGNTECVALVTDPAPDAQRQNRCYFGPLVGDLSQTWRRAGAWEAKINMVSIF